MTDAVETRHWGRSLLVDVRAAADPQTLAKLHVPPGDAEFAQTVPQLRLTLLPALRFIRVPKHSVLQLGVGVLQGLGHVVLCQGQRVISESHYK